MSLGYSNKFSFLEFSVYNFHFSRLPQSALVRVTINKQTHTHPTRSLEECALVPPYSQGYDPRPAVDACSQDSTEHSLPLSIIYYILYIYIMFYPILYIPVTKFNLQIRHSKILKTINNKIEQL